MSPAAVALAWTFEVVFALGGLTVEARLPAAFTGDVAVSARARPYVSAVEGLGAGGWRAVAATTVGWHVDSAAALRWRFALERAARDLDDPDLAVLFGGAAIGTSPSAWLLRPAPPVDERVHLTVPPGVPFVTAAFPGAGPPPSFDLVARDCDDAPLAIFGALRPRTLTVPGATLDLAFGAGAFAASDDALAAWVRDEARALAAYLGRFPVRHALVVLTPFDGAEGGGTSFGGGGALRTYPGIPLPSPDDR